MLWLCILEKLHSNFPELMLSAGAPSPLPKQCPDTTFVSSRGHHVDSECGHAAGELAGEVEDQADIQAQGEKTGPWFVCVTASDI